MTDTHNCEDCKDTGKILAEGMMLGRPQYIDGKLQVPYATDGNWKEAECHCVGEEE